MFKLGPNATIFVLFFGVALVDAIRHGEIVMSLVYVVLGVLFLRAGRVSEPTFGR